MAFRPTRRALLTAAHAKSPGLHRAALLDRRRRQWPRHRPQAGRRQERRHAQPERRDLARFASEKDRDPFKSRPEAYAPQYGGYCAWAVSQGYAAQGDPAQGSIIGGKLHLNYNASVRMTWEKDPTANIASGNTNRPKVPKQ